MEQEIIKIIQNLKGTILGIGLTEEMVQSLEKNNTITDCNLLNSYVKEGIGKKKRLKTLKIKKLNKYFKKKSIDTIICNYQEIQKYMNTFVKNSVYINRKKLYFFGELDKEFITHRYDRYDTVISYIDTKDGNIISIDNSNSKNNKIKDILYRIIDGITSMIDMIGDILMN